MNAWRALLVAEFRRTAGFLPWLAGLHGLTLGARTRWAWDISPQSLALLEWASWTVTGLVVGISLWQDAPLRRDRFLATRPSRLAWLVTAKAPALWGIAVLPFVAVEFAALRLNGMAGGVVAWGTVQLAVWLTTLLAAAFPLLWWWSTRRMAVVGLLTGVAAVVLTTLALSRLPGNRNIYTGTPWTVPVGPLSLLGTTGLFALGGCLLLPLLRGRGPVLRGLAFSALAALSLCGGLAISLRQAPADEIIPASLVDLTVQCEKYQSGDYDILSLKVPSYPVPVDIERTWHLARLEADGRNITQWAGDGTDADGRSGSLRRVIEEQLGKLLKRNNGTSWGPEPTETGVLPGRHEPSRRLRLAVDMMEIHHTWEVVADLPAKAGATACHGDTRWRIVNLVKDTAKGNTGPGSFHPIRLEMTDTRRWLGKPAAWRGNAGSKDVLVVVDLTRGVVIEAIDKVSGPAAGSLWPPATALRHQRLWDHMWSTGEAVDWGHEIRYVIARPKVIRRILHPWRPQDEIQLRIGPAESYHQSSPAESSLGLPIAAWLAAHPVPGEGASATAAEAWVEELRGFLDAPRNYRAVADADLKRAVAAMVADHPEVVLEARHHWSWYGNVGGMLKEAFGDSLTADILAQHPNWHTDPLVVALAVSKGWVPVIADAVTRKARGGGITDVRAALTGAPEQIGLSEAEWLDYLRLRPSGATYQALADKVVPRSVLDREAERILGPLRTRQTDSGWPLLDLALGSGHRAGPQWLREELSSPRWHSTYQANLLMAYFVTPELPVVRGQSREEQFRNWFLGQDVSRFIYDRQTRKYHLP